jgi:hypothetical protein
MAVDIPTLSHFTLKVFAPIGGKVSPALQAQTTQLFQRMADTMPWLPYNPVSMAALAFNQGTYPYPTPTTTMTVVPSVITQYADRVALWNQLANLFKPITAAVLNNDMATAQNLGYQLDANADFWNTVAKYTDVDEIMKVWDDFWSVVASYRVSRDAATAQLKISQDIINQYGSQVPSNLSSQVPALQAQISSLDAQARSAFGKIPTATASAGLGVFPLVAVAVSSVVVTIVIGATTIGYHIVTSMTEVQKQASQNATDLVNWRNVADQADYESGKITNAELMQRREQTAQQANDIVKNQGAQGIGSAFAKITTGMAMGIGAIVLAGFGAFLLLRKKSSD